MDYYNNLLNKLKKAISPKERLLILLHEKKVFDYLDKSPLLKLILHKLSQDEQYTIICLIILGQVDYVFNLPPNFKGDLITLLKDLAKDLIPIERFYSPIGGIIGYHLSFLKLLNEKEHILKQKNLTFYEPSYFDIQKNSQEVEKYINAGLKNLSQTALISPMGGSADRLKLYDVKSKNPLPTAKLPFLGRTLLEGIIKDLEGLEYLYFKTYKKKIITPVVIMTSEAKDNHRHILSICEENNWFKRGKENFFFIKQLSVPLITVEGNWVVQSPLKLSLKPGGHGVIWKLMQENGAFDFLFEKKRKFGLIRQINNPMAGLDYGLLALLGIGSLKKKAFGFAACPRIVKSAEGVDILREHKTPEGYYYGISNIEYTDFAKWGIEDSPQKNSNFSKYPSNTNILFADLKVIQKSIENKPLIAMIINLKSKVPSLDGKKEVLAGRLEMMMQNIADNLMDFRKTNITKEEQKKLKTFLTFNQRLKTISVTKKAYIQNKPIFETPRGCFYDLLYNYHDLLTNYCKMELPPMPSEEEYVNQGPSFIVQMLSAIGPLYSIISKKIIGGKMDYNSELQLEIADLYLENLKLNGSLLICSDLITDDGNYNLSKCKLTNIQVQNLGIDRKANNVFWQNKISRKESLKIILHKNSQIQAENITFKGSILLEVPPNHKMIVLQEKIKIKCKLEKLYS